MGVTILNLIVVAVMIIAGISDARTRTVSNWFSVILIALAAVNVFAFDMPWEISLFGGLLGFVPPLIVAMLNKGEGVGGADIKLSGALGLFLGFGLTIIVILASYIIQFIVAGIYRLVKGEQYRKIPHITYLAVSLCGLFLISIFI